MATHPTDEVLAALISMYEVGDLTPRRVATAVGHQLDGLARLRTWCFEELKTDVIWRKERADEVLSAVSQAVAVVLDGAQPQDPGRPLVVHLYVDQLGGRRWERWHVELRGRLPHVRDELAWGPRGDGTFRVRVDRLVHWYEHRYALAYGHVVGLVGESDGARWLRSANFVLEATPGVSKPAAKKVPKGTARRVLPP